MNHSLVRCAAIPALLLMFAANATACVAGKLLEPDASFPLATGKIFYHSYVEYGDGTGHLFQYDLATQQNTQLDEPGWGITDPINAFPHPDGSTITFMGVKDGNWNVFLYRLGSASAPVNVTAALGGRNEDPKFSRDGNHLVIKHEGDIYLGSVAYDATGQLGVSSWTAVTNDGFAIEESMPYFSADGQHIFYAQGARSTLRVFRVSVAGGSKEQWQVPVAGEADYYPVVRGVHHLLFTRITASGNDQIMQTSVMQSGGPATNVSMNECNANNSDAARTTGSYIAFSSTGYNFGHYGLMLGNIRNGKVWRFPPSLNANDGKDKLGASYSPD
jgi:Tol biopolymer transport system component